MNDIFTQATQSETPASQGDDALTTKLTSIVNENGEPKYADLPTALDALKASQDFIPTLKNEVNLKDQEIANLRNQIAESQGMIKAQEEMARLLTQPQAQPEAQSAPQPVAQDQVDINSLVQAAFQAHQQQTTAEKNLNEVNSVLASQYGEKAVEHLQNKAKALNTTAEAIQEMAKTNPSMALALLGTEKPKVTGSFGGSTNTAGFAAPQVAKLEAPKQSLLTGVSSNTVNDFMKQIQAEVYREHGINN
ncbi:coil containing protein [Vibrio phage 468E53-1]|nr:coil containing protein [Vibrio phage 468E53-1]CAH9015055.1 coil containing protein [Vibrio phage 177E37-1]